MVWLRTTGIPEAFADPGGPVPDYGVPGGMTTQQHIAWMESKTMLNRLTTLAEVGDAAAFAASDRAGAMTAAGMNLTSGSVPDY